ncbi:hypothetical protein GE061_005892 [Apolygus lucorum]|uniref:Regulatory protein zeste n=1 Tax=Apolygus lucorum TaxID=248454 RepID=A0A8S9WXM4_APOLU|nr:hypothetical protein GE061_005892 [Apolygus lucorum]
MHNKDVVENKKTDALSVGLKKKCWEKIGVEYNSSGKYPTRTVMQLRKAWENIKTRRKALLALKKQGQLSTVRADYTPEIPPDPELDYLGVQIELRDCMDADTVLDRPKYLSEEDGTLVPLMEHQVVEEQEVVEEDTKPLFTQTKPLLEVMLEEGARQPASPATYPAPVLRKEGWHDRLTEQQYMLQSEELQKLKVEEGKMKVEEAKLKVEEANLRVEEAKLKVEEAKLRIEEANLRVEEAKLRIVDAKHRIHLKKREMGSMG